MKTVHLIGTGLIGQERLKAIKKLQARGLAVKVGHVFDPFQPKLVELSKEYNFTITQSLQQLLDTPADLTVIACPHDVAAVQSCTALRAGHKVLIEKPMGRNLVEANAIMQAAKNGKGFHVGLNYRFMKGVSSLMTDWKSKRFGKPISVRMEIGHGGKPGDEKTWKLDPLRCSGGALLDPGIHVLDLCSILAGKSPDIIAATSWNGFWKTGIEEDVQLLLKSGQLNISLEISVVRWRSHFEIFALGTEGYGHLSGRGRSYGPQIYKRGKRWGWQRAKDQASSEEIVVNDSCEDSFTDELAAYLGFTSDVNTEITNPNDGLELMRLYESVKMKLKEMD